MDCPTCKIKMIERTGRYGDFFYCPEHGTISARVAKMLIAGAQRPTHQNPPVESDLLHQVKVQSYAMGMPTDDLGQLCEWIVDQGDPNDDDDDDDDNWTNIRPY